MYFGFGNAGYGCGCQNYYPPVAGVGYGTGFNFPLIVVLFILLIIIGCSWQEKIPC